MTLRQRILKLLYPLIIQLSKKSSKQLNNPQHIVAPVSFYDLSASTIQGEPLSFKAFEGKKVLIVNTASDCGYTQQYEGLEKIFQNKSNNIMVIGFPSNDFKDQEKGSNEEIAQFCKINYGVSFPLMKKTSVVKSSSQNPVFEWLSNPSKNGWCNQVPTWNFCKYIINEKGILTHFYDAKTDPSAIIL